MTPNPVNPQAPEDAPAGDGTPTGPVAVVRVQPTPSATSHLPPPPPFTAAAPQGSPDLEATVASSDDPVIHEASEASQKESEPEPAATGGDGVDTASAGGFAAAGCGLAIVDGAGRLTRVNAEFARLHGGTPAQLQGRHTLDVVPLAASALGQAGLAAGPDHPPVVFTAPAEHGPVNYRVQRLGSDTAMGLLLEADQVPAGDGQVRPDRRLAPRLPVPMLVVDHHGVVVDANPAAAGLLSRGEADLSGRQFETLAHPESVSAARNCLAVPAPTDKAARRPTELRLVRATGGSVWVEPLVDHHAVADQLDGGALVILNDITERRRSEQLLHDAFEIGPRPLVMIDPVGMVLASNDAWRHQFGVADENPASLAEVIDAEAFAELGNQLDAVAARESLVVDLHAVVGGTGPHPRAVHATGSAIHDLEGRLEQILVAFDDTTEQALGIESARLAAARVRASFDLVDLAVVVHDADGCASEVNLGAHRLFGSAATDLVGEEALPAWWRPATADGTPLPPDRHPANRVLRGPLPRAETTIRVTPPGSGPRWLMARARPITDSTGRVGAVVTYSEVTEQLAQLNAVSEDESELRTLLDEAPVAIYAADADLNLMRSNAAWNALNTDSRGQADPLGLVHPHHRRRVGDALAAVLTDGRTRELHHRIKADGPASWVHHRIAARSLPTGEVTGVVGTMQPVPDWVAESERTRRLVNLVETTNDLVGEYDVALGRITYLNPRALELFCGPGSSTDNADPQAMYSPDAFDLFWNEAWPELRDHGRWEGELPMRTASGRIIQVQQWVTADFGADGELVRLASAGHDVTDRSQRDAELLLRATHDNLTGLANRSLLLDHLDLALNRARRTGQLVALILLDIDRFKTVNDQLGVPAGDRVLAMMGERIRDCARPGDTTARLGGDEFAIVCDGVDDAADALALADAVASAIRSRPFEIGGTHIAATIAVGVAVSAGVDHPEALLRDAGAAMYRAKDLGGARIELFDETMRSQASRRVRLATELRSAVGDGEIIVHYQPAIDLRTGAVRCIEALARWRHPERGLLSPSEFIAVADSTGAVAELGMEVLRQACTCAMGWVERWGEAAPRINVNLSPRQMNDRDVARRIALVLEDTGLPADRLCLEITESVLLDDREATLATIDSIKALGVTLAIDDFGTGYSSLSYLNRLPIDVVKLDKSFVDGLDPIDGDAPVVAAAIISLARALKLATIAEGVTTVVQLAELHRLGCDAAQGFYFSPPLDHGGIDRYLARKLGPDDGTGADPTGG